MAAHADARGVAMEVPLRRCCRQHIFHIHVHGRENPSEFVDQGDVDVTLNVLNDLGRLSDLKLTDIADVFARELTVELDQRFTHLGIGTPITRATERTPWAASPGLKRSGQ